MKKQRGLSSRSPYLSKLTWERQFDKLWQYSHSAPRMQQPRRQATMSEQSCYSSFVFGRAVCLAAMQFQLSDEHRLIQETARRIAKERIAPRAAEIDEQGEYPHDIFEAFQDVGLLGLTIPQSYGGSGAGMLALALAVEEAAKYCCASGLMLLLSALPTQPLVIGGSERQKQELLPHIARGEAKAAFCLTEPNAGSDASALESRAVRDGDDYVLNGEKVFISGGTVADYVVVFAKSDGKSGPKGISGFVVTTDSPGFSVARTDRKMGVRGVPTANLVFDNVRVPRERLLGEEEGNGFSHAMLTLNSCRPVVGARGLGLAEGALSYALEYARQRQAFGKPIAELQAIQFIFADLAIGIEAARLLVYQGAWLVDQGSTSARTLRCYRSRRRSRLS